MCFGKKIDPVFFDTGSISYIAKSGFCSKNKVDKYKKRVIINLAAAELCKGSTTDSDSVCWGSNPYSAAIRESP